MQKAAQNSGLFVSERMYCKWTLLKVIAGKQVSAGSSFTPQGGQRPQVLSTSLRVKIRKRRFQRLHS
jgi:hypothetical protein